MVSINSSSGALSNLAVSLNRSLVDPRKYENFTVQVGARTSPDGVLGGVLSQEDYDKFKEIVKDVNVMDASYTDMFTVYRKLEDAHLLSDKKLGPSFILGSVEFDPLTGAGINYDSKYNQLEFQKTALPIYAGAEFNETRGMAIEGFKFVAAIANASPVTGVTVAEYAFSPQDRAAGEKYASAGVHIDFSEMAQRLSRGEKLDELDAPPGLDIAKLIKLLEQMALAQRAAKAAETAKAQE